MRAVWVLCAVLSCALPQVSRAEDGCEKFAWHLARVRTRFAAAEKPSFAAGESVCGIPKGAFVLKLQQGGEASFALAPERKPRSERWFGGMLRISALEGVGIFEVTASQQTWIDIVQDGRYARSIGTTGRSDCPGVRKSVRFELGSGPLVLQVSGVETDVVVLAIARGE